MVLDYNIMLVVFLILILAVIFVNGWTDAPNAIATCISTRCINVTQAIWMAAICNFIGVLAMTMLNAKVAFTLYNMVDFGSNEKVAFIALCGALVAIVVWATGAWYFGIPTSESHALIAGVSGAAIALQGGFRNVRLQEWMKVLVGLGMSAVLGFGLGYLFAKGIGLLLRRHTRTRVGPWLKNAQVLAGAAMAFMHGAQDGQKFIGVFMLGLMLLRGGNAEGTFVIPLWMMLLCSVVMALGTSAGGYRILKSVGMDLVKLEVYQGFAADAASVVCLFLSSINGIPVSTTHTKTTAIMGVGAAKRWSSVHWGVVREMVVAWVLTFPCCGLIGYGVAWLFIRMV